MIPPPSLELAKLDLLAFEAWKILMEMTQSRTCNCYVCTDSITPKSKYVLGPLGQNDIIALPMIIFTMYIFSHIFVFNILKMDKYDTDYF